MLEKIDSSFFIQLFFSYLNNERALKAIRYNKKLQNLIGVNLYNYKLLSGKYIEYETNERVKIYNACKNELLYEGGYLGGKKNGKGKEYWMNVVIFEGEYKNGKKNGKGKEYSVFGKIKFEGEYLNDLKLTGKEYDYKGNIIFDLENGIGILKEYYDGGKLKFEGEYLNGNKNGKGIEYYYNGELVFEGEYLN